MDRFPKMLFRFPGTLPDAVALQDGKYDLVTVDGEKAHDAAIAEGWSETAAEAREANAAKTVATIGASTGQTATVDATAEAAADLADATKPPTRAELEAKAAELGVNFRYNTSDKVLADRIAAALEP